MRYRPPLAALLPATLSLIVATAALAADEPAGDSGTPSASKATKGAKDIEKPADAKPEEVPAASGGPSPATHTVKKGLLKIEVVLDGVFQAQRMTEIILRPEAWTTLKILSAVEHGARVKRGDLLVALDLEQIDRAITDLRTELKETDLSIQLAAQQLASLQKTTPMDLAAAQRVQKQAREDLQYYLEVTHPMSLRSAAFSLKSAEQFLEYQEEEFRQLEKMYQADDLTEETEEIVLKRARNDLERAKFSLERSKISYDERIKRDIPRADISIKELTRRAELHGNDTKVSLPVALKKQRMAFEKLKLGRARSEERLKKMLADRATMTVKAPAGGVVYYGKCTRGKFSGASSSLVPGSSLSANKVFMTIVQPRPMSIRASVPAKQLGDVRTGVKGIAQPTGFADMQLDAIVQSVGTIPMATGSFDGQITVALDDQAAALMPGMTCKVKLVPYLKKHAVTVPPSSVAADKLDQRKHYVCRLGKDGKQQKRHVTVGRRTAKQVEILKGLAEGDRILLQCPSDLK